jgi:hypothetical protein
MSFPREPSTHSDTRCDLSKHSEVHSWFYSCQEPRAETRLVYGTCTYKVGNLFRHTFSIFRHSIAWAHRTHLTSSQRIDTECVVLSNFVHKLHFKQEFLRRNLLPSFHTIQIAYKATRPTVILLLRVFDAARTRLPSRCLATIGEYIQTHRLIGGKYAVKMELSCHDMYTMFRTDPFKHSKFRKRDRNTDSKVIS